MDGTPLRFTPDTRTPCCSRIPHFIGDRRYVCKGCGTIYVDQTVMLRAAFPGIIDVTAMTPRRFLTSSEPQIYEGWPEG